jgi:hypothetical protein
MKKTTKKSSSKASHKRARKNLDVTPAKGGTIRGGKPIKFGDIMGESTDQPHKDWVQILSYDHK